MMTLPIGFISTLVLIYYSMGSQSIFMYFNSHAVALVIGGTFTVFLMSNPTAIIKQLFSDSLSLFAKANQLEHIQDSLIELTKNRTKKINFRDELVEYAQELWEQGISSDLFVVLLSQKKQDIEQRSALAIQSLKNLSKYPPALGMAGTVIGVVTLFQSLGNDRERLGAALALAMTATFLGLIVANAVVMPLADRLQMKCSKEKLYFQNVYQILLLINQNELSEFIADEVKARAASA